MFIEAPFAELKEQPYSKDLVDLIVKSAVLSVYGKRFNYAKELLAFCFANHLRVEIDEHLLRFLLINEQYKYIDLLINSHVILKWPQHGDSLSPPKPDDYLKAPDIVEYIFTFPQRVVPKYHRVANELKLKKVMALLLKIITYLPDTFNYGSLVRQIVDHNGHYYLIRELQEQQSVMVSLHRAIMTERANFSDKVREALKQALLQESISMQKYNITFEVLVAFGKELRDAQ